MIILVRHAQSEGNKNRDIHQFIPDHRVKLTQLGWSQVRPAPHHAVVRLSELLTDHPPPNTDHCCTHRLKKRVASFAPS